MAHVWFVLEVVAFAVWLAAIAEVAETIAVRTANAAYLEGTRHALPARAGDGRFAKRQRVASGKQNSDARF